MSIATFAAAEDRAQVCPVVSVSVCLKGYPNDTISLYVVPTICEPLSFQPVKASVMAYSHLRGLDLADSIEGREGLPIDVLIGCDHYWDLITGTVCRGKEGPIAIHSKLGWVLSGAAILMKQVTSSLTCNVATHSLRVDGHPIGSEQLEERFGHFGSWRP